MKWIKCQRISPTSAKESQVLPRSKGSVTYVNLHSVIQVGSPKYDNNYRQFDLTF